MSDSAEKRAARKAAAREFHNNLPPKRSAMSRLFACPNDDPDEKIPKHGPRGSGRVSLLDKPVSKMAKTSSIYSRILVKDAEAGQFLEESVGLIGKKIIAEENAQPVIFDTNVVVAGFLQPDIYCKSKRLMDLAMTAGRIAPQVTLPIVDEYKNILRREGGELNQLRALLSRSVLIPDCSEVRVKPVEEDFSDTIFLAALVQSIRAGRGDQYPTTKLVTMDHHLRALVRFPPEEPFLNGNIVTPQKLLKDLRR